MYNKKKIIKQTYCGDAGHRSLYLSHAKRALYHLSYIPNKRTYYFYKIKTHESFTNYSDEILQTVSLFLLNINFSNSTYPLLYPSNFLRSSMFSS